MSAAMPSESGVLEAFSAAKRKIAEIFDIIDQHIEALQVFIENLSKCDPENILHADALSGLNHYATKVNRINEILNRNSMKVGFFGRTSNGKSTCINAMLWDKELVLLLYCNIFVS